MKKLVLALAGVMLASSLFAFAGCDTVGNTGVVKGNYKYVTLEEATQAIETLDMQNAFGDSAQEDSKVGFETKLNMAVDISANAKLNESTLVIAEVKGTSNAKANIKVVVDPNGEAPVLGKGEVSLNEKTKTFEKKNFFVPSEETTNEKSTKKSKASGKVYLDSKYMYLDGHVDSDEEKGDVKARFILNKVLQKITDQIGDLPGGAITGGEDTSMDLEATISSMMYAGYYVALDQSSGLKIRITANEKQLKSAFKNMGIRIPYATWENTEFSTAEYALYLAFDKDGKFAKAGFHMEFEGEAEYEQPTIFYQRTMITKTKFSIKCGVELKPFNGTITLPEDLKDYKTQDFNLK